MRRNIGCSRSARTPRTMPSTIRSRAVSPAASAPAVTTRLLHSRVIRSAISVAMSGHRRDIVIRETPARRATSVSVVRRRPTARTQSRAASSSASSAEVLRLDGMCNSVTMTTLRWGDPADAVELPPAVRALLGSVLGVTGPRPAVPVALAPPAALPAALHADVSDRARLEHAAGMSTEDLLRARAGDLADAPDG